MLKGCLTQDEIEEEMINGDLLNCGALDNEDELNEMNLEEKRELLNQIKKSKETLPSQSASPSPDQTELKTYSFPSTGGKKKADNKLQLSKNESPSPKTIESDSEKHEEQTFSSGIARSRKFNLPFCNDDGALPLRMPERPSSKRKPFCVMLGETPSAALKRMLDEHNQWKTAYLKEINGTSNEFQASRVDTEIKQDCTSKTSLSPQLVLTKVGELKHPYRFESDSPIRKDRTCPRRWETKSQSNEMAQNNQQVRTLQRKPSRDSDCEEMEPILKPADQKDWINVPRQRSKRNKKQNNQEKGRPKCVENNTEVQFEFNNTWNKQPTIWNAPQSPSMGSLNNHPRRAPSSTPPAAEEEMVECPICQRRFPLSKVENHAATCEGFSPMEVEEN